MAGLAYALESEPPVGRLAGFGRALAFGVGANMVALRFVPEVIARFTPLSMLVGFVALVLLAAFEGLRWAAAGVVSEALVKRGVARPASFAIGVYAGTFVPTVLPWSAAGGVTPWPAMVQLADVVGERGVTALMALAAGLAAHALRHRSLRSGAMAALLPLAMLAYGAARIGAIDRARESAPTEKLALVQPSIEARARWDKAQAPEILRKLSVLTRDAEGRGAELTIWPEAAYPYPLPHTSRHSPYGSEAILQLGVRGPVLTGLVMNGNPGESYNSATVAFTNGTLAAPYDKLHLLWFGEAVPFADKSGWMRRTFARGVGLVAGDAPVLLEAGRVRAAVLNCFEDTLPDAGREAQSLAPNLLVNITNDAWFAGSAESELHLRLAALRAVELRRDLVRAVNFGPTSWVDAAGRVRARQEGDKAAALLVEPALLESPPTFFARYGDAPCAIALLAAAVALALTKRRRAPLP